MSDTDFVVALAHVRRYLNEHELGALAAIGHNITEMEAAHAELEAELARLRHELQAQPQSASEVATHLENAALRNELVQAKGQRDHNLRAAYWLVAGHYPAIVRFDRGVARWEALTNKQRVEYALAATAEPEETADMPRSPDDAHRRRDEARDHGRTEGQQP